MWLTARVCLILLICLSTSAMAVELTPRESAGKRLYRQGRSASSAEVSARVGAADIVVPGAVAACTNCHGADGRGRPEGGVRPPDITWRRLSAPYGQRDINGRSYQAYDERALVRAVTEGLDPDGNRLDPAMPRFVLSSADQLSLAAYLKRLEDDRDPGLENDWLRLGTLLPGSGPLAEPGRTVAAVLRDSIERINAAGGIHGRHLQLRILDPGPDQASAEQALHQLIDDEQVFALVAPLVPALNSRLPALLEAAEVPMVGPQTLLGINSLSSRQIFEPLPGLREQFRALANYAIDNLELTATPALIVYPADGSLDDQVDNLQQYLNEHGWPQVRRHAYSADKHAGLIGAAGDVNALFYLGSGEHFSNLVGRLHDAGLKPNLFAASAQVAGDLQQLPEEFSRRLFIAYPFVPGDWSAPGRRALTGLRSRQGLDGQHAVLQVSAYCSMALLGEALKRAGRDVSREGLIEALESLHDFDTGLTPRVSFGPGKRMGLSGAHIVTIDLGLLQFYPVAPYIPLDTTP
jgi:ABC-type branched-subunit amino acid transport system substrate-binding protein